MDDATTMLSPASWKMWADGTGRRFCGWWSNWRIVG